MRTRKGVDPVAALLSLDGSARRHELYEHGVRRPSLDAAVAQNRVAHPSWGTYSLPERTADIHAIAARNSATIACASAAKLQGLWLWTDPQQPHLLVDHGRGIAGCVAHRGRRSGAVTNVYDTVVQCIRCLPPFEALVVAESSVVHGHLTVEQLQSAFEGKGALRARTLLARIDARAMSPLETAARVVLADAGFGVVPQWRARGIGRIDLGVWDPVVGGGVMVGVELDGFAFHSDRVAFSEDRRRHNAAALAGITVLRFTADDLREHPDSVVACVREALVLRAR